MNKCVLFFLLIVICGLASCSGMGGRGQTQTPGDKTMSGYNLPKTRPDPILFRRIVLLHPGSGERLDILYFHEGHYDAEALARINHLFRDRRAGVVGKIDPELIDYLVDIRTRLNLPPTIIFEVLSGYRSPATNAYLARSNPNVATESTHMRGWAVDFRIPGVDGRAICAVAETMQRGGVAFYPKSNHVHVDISNIRTWNEK